MSYIPTNFLDSLISCRRPLKFLIGAVFLFMFSWLATTSAPGASAQSQSQPDPAIAACYLVGDGYDGGQGDDDDQDTLLRADFGAFSKAAIPGGSSTDHTGTFNIEAIEWDYTGTTLYAADADELGTLNTSTGVYSTLSGSNNGQFTTDNNDATICVRDGSTFTTKTENINDVDGLAYSILDDAWWGTDREGSSPDYLFPFDPTAVNDADGLLIRGQFVLPATGGGNHTCDAVEIEPVSDPEATLLEGIDDVIFDPFTNVMYGVANTGSGSATKVVRIDTSDGSVTDLGTIFYAPSTNDYLRDTEGFGIDETGRLFVSTGKDGTDAGVTGNQLFQLDRNDIIGSGGNISATFVGDLENSRDDEWPVDFEAVTCFNIDEQDIAFLGDFVWADDGDGIQQINEPGVPGVTVRLYSDVDGDPNTTGDQTLEDTVSTGFNGKYLFTVSPGINYLVEFDAVGALTLQDQGSDALDSDADPATGRTGIYTLTSDEQILTVDAGLIEQPVDWGDAADPPYPTLSTSAGPRHIIGDGLYLGDCVDSEADGLQSSGADGDDNDSGTTTVGTCDQSGDDEDGINFVGSLTAGQSADVEVTATGTNSAGAILDAWCDWDQSGSFEPGEDFESILGGGPIALTGGGTTDTLNFTVPPSSSGGTTDCRFRVSSSGGLNPVGFASDGEVEDYQVNVDAPDEDRDWGDAPDPDYPTLSAPPDSTPPDGASHLIGEQDSPFMGQCVDSEADGQPTPGANGDDNGAGSTTVGTCLQDDDDEDGVTFIGLLTPGATGVIAAIDMSASPTDCKINAWIDFNADGDWNDTGEQILTDADAPAQVLAVQLSFFVPGTAVSGDTYARFRCNSAGGLNPGGPASDGEVEDYPVTIGTADLDLDWGDAPGSYPTTAANGGANHIIIVQNVFLGSCVDSEGDGQPTAGANGDDVGTGTTTQGTCQEAGDDEDGVVFTSSLQPGQPATFDVTASNVCTLSAFMDWNDDGDWDDAGEDLFPSGIVLTPGVNNLNTNVPGGAAQALIAARFRCSVSGKLPAGGPAPDGEVEDYELLVSESVLDFGDLPDSYSTLSSSNGARHISLPSNNPTLGNELDTEPNGVPSSNANGDDTASTSDEDGVVPVGNWSDGTGNLLVTVTGADGCLNVWVDFTDGSTLSADGDFEDTYNSGGTFPEHVYVDQAIAVGASTPVNFNLPPDVADDATLAIRVRLTPTDQAGGCGAADAYGGTSSFEGPATGGEVEDYFQSFTPTALTLTGFTGAQAVNNVLLILVPILILLLSTLYIVRRKRI